MRPLLAVQIALPLIAVAALAGCQPKTPAPKPNGGALPTMERVALDDVPAMISDGRLLDSKTIIGLLLVRDRRASG